MMANAAVTNCPSNLMDVDRRPFFAGPVSISQLPTQEVDRAGRRKSRAVQQSSRCRFTADGPSPSPLCGSSLSRCYAGRGLSVDRVLIHGGRAVLDELEPERRVSTHEPLHD